MRRHDFFACFEGLRKIDIVAAIGAGSLVRFLDRNLQIVGLKLFESVAIESDLIQIRRRSYRSFQAGKDHFELVRHHDDFLSTRLLDLQMVRAHGDYRKFLQGFLPGVLVKLREDPISNYALATCSAIGEDHPERKKRNWLSLKSRSCTYLDLRFFFFDSPSNSL